MWYNEYSDFFYQHIYGDKETFHMGFRKLGQPYAQPEMPPDELDSTLGHYDFEGRRLFQHRNDDKWTLTRENKQVAGFLYEEECRDYLNVLSRVWNEWRPSESPSPEPDSKYFEEIQGSASYDVRFFKDEPTLSERQSVLTCLLQAFSALCATANTKPILMHGGLIGWHVNGRMLPWEANFSLCLTLEDLQLLEACKHVYDEENFLFDINPFFCDRRTLNKKPHENAEPNKSDARFIDRATGVFIDITALADEGETLVTKCPHRYRREIVFPLQLTEFLGASLFAPANVPAVLIQEYGPGVVHPHGEIRKGYTFDSERNEYVRTM